MSQDKVIKIHNVYMCQNFSIDSMGRPNAYGIIGPSFLYGLGPEEFLNIKIFGSVFSSFEGRKVVIVSLLDPNDEEVVPPSTFFVNYSSGVDTMFVAEMSGVVSFNKLGKYRLVFSNRDDRKKIGEMALLVVDPLKLKGRDTAGHFSLPNGLQIPNDPRFMKILKRDIEEYKNNC